MGCETGGVRIAHLGDNGPLTSQAASALGRVDVLLIPVDGDEHILKADEVGAIRRQLNPRLLIPMHYRMRGLSRLPRSLGPIDPWLENQTGVNRVGSHRMSLSQLPADPQIAVLEPSPEVKAWDGAFHRATEIADQGNDLLREQPGRATKLFEQAISIDDRFIGIQLGLALAMSGSGQRPGAITILEKALVGATTDDWEFTQRTRIALARLYVAEDRTEEARALYQMVLRDSWRTALIEEARQFLSTPNQ